MKIKSNSITNGYFKDEMGHHGTQFLKNIMPNYSFHLAWDNLPPGTQSLALTFVDHDAIPFCGFTWIHWLAANIDPTLNELPENASEKMNLLQGVNSWGSGIIPKEYQLSKEDASRYGGCAPPDKDHLYTIELYALDKKLDLPSGFMMNELLKAMKGHVLDKATLEALYKTK
ncbi:MAG: YbhB/YbcL family Raf kinase inhibitor-like protein [Pseudomonadota bacterium]